jgi:hypothetical protein
MSIIGRRSLLRAWIDSFEVELEPPARLGPPRRSSSSAEAGPSVGASGSTAPERSAKEGSGLIRCRAIATRHLALAPSVPNPRAYPSGSRPPDQVASSPGLG